MIEVTTSIVTKTGDNTSPTAPKDFSANPTKQSILSHYQALGFREGEEFVVRAANGKHQNVFFGKFGVDHFQLWETQPRGRDRDGLRIYKRGQEIPDPVITLQLLGNEGYDIFSYPNHVQGGLGNKHAKGFTSIFFEFDDLPLDQQWEKVKELEQVGLVPSQVVFSGRKSLHVYFRLSEAVPAQDWKLLNRMLAAYMGSDPTICTLARAMRLPGVNRIKDGKTKAVEIQSQSAAVYSPQQVKEILGVKFPHGLSDERWKYAQRALKNGTDKKGRNLDELLVLPEGELNPKPVYTRTYQPKPVYTQTHPSQPIEQGTSFPLEICLTRDDRDLIANGVGSYRNDTGRKLALNLIGTADRLTQLGYSFDGDPYQLFIDYCQRCPSGGGWDQHEWDTIWKSAEGDNPTPSLTDEMLENCIRAWQWKQLPESEKRKRHKGGGLLTKEEYEEKFGKNRFLEDVRRKVLGLGKKFKKGFGYLIGAKEVEAPKVINYKEGDPLPTPDDYKGKCRPKIIFKKGQDRLKVITQLKALGWTDVMDSSWMGLGKSHWMGLLEPEDGHKLFYIDKNHRNVSTETVRDNFTDLNPRHDGIYRDQKGKLQIAKNPQEKAHAEIESNCSFADLFNLAKSKGHQIEGEKNPICAGCANLYRCHQEEGKGYGFKSQRKNTLSHKKIRCAVESLTDDVIQPGDIAILEETSKLISPTVTVKGTWEDLLQQFDYLEVNHPELYPPFTPIKNQLRRLLKGGVEQTQYGLDHDALLDILGDTPENIEEIVEALEQAQMAVGELIEEPDSVTGVGGHFRDAGNAARRHFKREAHERTRAHFENLHNNLLLPLLKVWGGLTPGRLRLNFDALSVKTRNDYQIEVLKGFSFRIHLDATVNQRWLVQALDLNRDTTIEISQEMPNLSNLTVYNTQMEGLKTRDRSDTAKERVAAYKKAALERDPNTKFLDHKGTDDIDGWWGNHNRGTNAFKGVANLVSFGTPYPNLGQLQDEYAILFGSLDGFEEFYQEQVAAEIIQKVGRPRAHQFPHQQFHLDFVGTNQNLSFLTKRYGIRVINRHAFSVTPEAGTEKQQAEWAVTQAAIKVAESGEKFTQDNIGAKIGISQKYVSKLMKGFKGGWQEFKKLLLSLYGTLYRGSSKNLNLYTYWDDWLHCDPVEVVEECCRIIHDHGWRDFQELLSEASEVVQIQILGLIAPVVLPELVIDDESGEGKIPVSP